MKTYTQLCEDIEARRQELRQRQLDAMDKQKQRVADYQQKLRDDREEKLERERLKKEIAQELRMKSS